MDINYGLLPDTRSPEEKARDYVFGATTKVIPEILQEDGQWSSFLPTYEYQNLDGFDKMACVTYSATNCLEIIYKRKYGVEQNISDRFTATLSGTTPQGNSLYKVAESLRKIDGKCPQSLWKNEGKTWAEWYSEVPEAIRTEAKKSLDEYLIQYEWVPEPMTPEHLMEGLKYSPLQIGVYAYGPLVNGIYQAPVGMQMNHAITLIGYKEGEYWLIFDHYKGNETRKLAWDYPIGCALKFNITRKTMVFKKEIGKPSIYAIIGDKKVMVVDMPTLTALGGTTYEEVESLAMYPENGTISWYERIIN